MSFLSGLSDFAKFISKPVGNNVENQEQDVRTIRDSFEAVDAFKDEEKERDYQGNTLGIVTRGLDEKIKGFQRDNDLRVDGLINLGGETEGALSQKLKEKRYSLDITPQAPSTPSRQDDFTLVDGGLRINKDKVAEGVERLLLSQASEKQTPLPAKKPVLTTEERKEAILNDDKKNFKIVSNDEARSLPPLHRLSFLNSVKKYEGIIDRQAKKADIDSDLVKSIVYVENSQGWYDSIIGDKNKTIRPMNVHVDYWKKLGYSREDLKDDSKNIEAGIILLKRISKNVPDGDVSKIATLYNSLGKRKVTDYGRRVERVYKQKPWKKK